MNSIARKIVAAEPAPEVLDPGKRRPKVSVVMVVYRTGEALRHSIDCVLREPLVDEFVIVDNGSPELDSVWLQTLASREPKVLLKQGHGNVGFAKGANMGARAAGGDILVFLNPDAFLQPGCIEQLARAIENEARLTVVGGRVLNADRTEQRGARRGEITPVSALMSFSHLARNKAWRRYEVHREFEAPPEGVVAIPTISGACFAMRHEDFDAVEGFDEGYFLHVEDVDLCWRVRRQGGQVLFQPKAEVIHLGHTSQTSPLKVEFHKGVGLARYFRKRAATVAEHLTAWLLSPLIVCTAVARPIVRGAVARR
ncbi:MAG TPA: glycosyltransferase family 2 protein [Phenylobacterium sp.]|nr:glycosyltransferase family 2 protein [Phenylobacterium sp.]